MLNICSENGFGMLDLSISSIELSFEPTFQSGYTGSRLLHCVGGLKGINGSDCWDIG